MSGTSVSARVAEPDASHGAFGRVLVAVGDDDPGPALGLARALAADDAAFVLVHLRAGHGVAGTLPVDSEPDSTAHAMDVLTGARAMLGRPCELVAEAAPTVAAGLHRIAGRERADLLVCSRHRGASRDEARGVRGILHGAPCAVAIASTGSGPVELRRVGVAYRPTAPGRHAVAVGRAIAAAAGAELHALTVVAGAPSPWLGPVGGGARELARLDGALADLARGDLAELGGVVGHVVEGERVRALRRFSRSVDLLVVGTRSSGPLRRLVSGSTSDALATTAPGALLVVGCDDDAAGDAQTPPR